MVAFHARNLLPIVVIEQKGAKSLVLISNLLCNINLSFVSTCKPQ